MYESDRNMPALRQFFKGINACDYAASTESYGVSALAFCKSSHALAFSIGRRSRCDG